MGKVWDKTSILALLDRNDYAVLRAIIAIYQRQTNAEKEGKGTIERNGVGFGAYDGEYLSEIAGKLLDQDFVRVTPWLRDASKKYWRQLVEIANENEMKKMKEEKLV